MTSRERVVAALTGQPVDRLPHFEEYMAGFVARWRAERQIPPEVAIQDYFGTDITILTPEEGAFASQATVLDQRGDRVIRRDAWGRLLREQTGSWFYEVLAQPAATADECAALEFDDPLDPWRYQGYEQQLAACRQSQLAGFCKIGGPFLRTTFVRGETEYLEDIASDPEYAKLLADKMADHLIAVAVESLRRGGELVQQIGASMWDDIAYNKALLISPRSFEHIFLPAYARIVQACKAAGARWFWFHSDGDIRALLPYLAEIGVDLINPVEPRAGMDVVALAREYRGRLQFVGGVDNSGVICAGTPAEVRAHTAPIAAAARRGDGLIVGMHSVESDVPVVNFETYWQTLLAS